jgi:hypothetical protein
MTQKEDEERARRDEGRSEEAHWEVAEAAAADEVERRPETRQSDNREEEWEDEGGALGRARELDEPRGLGLPPEQPSDDGP